MKIIHASLSLFFISLIILLTVTNGFAQTEKFLKLNRIVNIDSTKSSVVPINETTVFEVTVPSGVVWKINQISTLVAAQTYQIKVGKTVFTGIASYINSGSSSGQSSYVSYGQNLGISYANSFWLTENSKVRIVGASGVGAHFLFLSAEEFILGQ
jgi:hypothetical protein